MRKRRRPSRITEGRSTSVWRKKKKKPSSFLLLLEWVLELLQEKEPPIKRGLCRCCRDGSLYTELVGHKGSYIRDLPWPFCCCCLLCVYHYHYQVVSSSKAAPTTSYFFFVEVAFFSPGFSWLMTFSTIITLIVSPIDQSHLGSATLYWRTLRGTESTFWAIKSYSFTLER